MRNIKANKIVVKIGTNALTYSNGMLDMEVMQNLVAQIAKIKKRGKYVLLITSGAIGAGMRELRIASRPKDVVMQQVCAAIGQSILMSKYHSLFGRHNIKVAQILLTYDAFSDKETYSNLRNSINKLLALGVVPIINENDPISIKEIGPSFGDNDMLSAFIAAKMGAELLVILTDVEGLFDKGPASKNAVLIKEVKSIGSELKGISGKAGSLGLGGMTTKIKAAQMATAAGSTVVIVNGKRDNVLTKLLNNEEIGTVFYPRK